MNRVFKGAIKAEPELLDELGIILRLDPAARKYAATLGKTAKELTTFEKQQAIVNEVLAQGNEKFAEFGDIDTNPFDRLASSFADITVHLTTMLSLPIIGILEFFTANTKALTAAILLFAASITKKAFPALSNLGGAMSDFLERKTAGINSALGKISTKLIALGKTNSKVTQTFAQNNAKLGKSIQEFAQKRVEALQKAGKTVPKGMQALSVLPPGTLEQFKKALQVLRIPIARLNNGLESIGLSGQASAAQMEGFAAGAQKALSKTAVQANLTGNIFANMFNIIKIGAFQATSSLLTFSNAVLNSTFSAGIKTWENGLMGFVASMKNASAKTGLFTKSFSLLGAGIGGAAAGLLRMVPTIAGITIAFSILSTAFNFLRDSFSDNKGAREEFTSSLESQRKVLDKTAKSTIYYEKSLKGLPKTLDNINKQLENQKNNLSEIRAGLDEQIRSLDALKGVGFISNLADIFGLGDFDEFKDQLEDTSEALKKLGLDREVLAIQSKFGNVLRLNEEEARAYATALEEVSKKHTNLKSAAQDANKALQESFKELNKNLVDMHGSLPKLSAVEKGVLNLRSGLAGLAGADTDKIISAFDEINTFGTKKLGIEDTLTALSKVTVKLRPLQKELDKILERRKELQGATTYGGILRAKKELGELDAQQQVLNTNINIYAKERAALTDIIIQKSNEQLAILDREINAEKVLNEVRRELAFAQGVPTNDLERRLKLLRAVTEAETTYLKDKIKATSLSNTQAEESIAILEKTLKSLNSLSKKDIASMSLEGQQSLETTKLQKNEELRKTQLAQLQLENKILEDKNRITDQYISQAQSIYKELESNNEASRLGLDYAKEQTNTIQTKLLLALNNVAKSQGKNTEKAKVWAMEQLKLYEATLRYKNLVKDIGISANLIKEVASMRNKNKELAFETQFLKNNNAEFVQRIDFEEQLAEAVAQRKLLELDDKILDAADTGDTTSELQLLKDREALEEKIVATKVAGQNKIANSYTKALNTLKAQTTVALEQLNQERNLTTAGKARLEVEKKILAFKLAYKDLTKDEINDYIKAISKLSNISLAEGFKKEIESITDSFSGLSNIIGEMWENFNNPEIDNATAAFKALYDIGQKAGDNVTKGFGQVGIAVGNFQEKLTLAKGDMEAVSEKDKFALLQGAIGGIATAMGEGSKAAQTLTSIMSTLATIQAASAIMQQATGGDVYSAFARMAAMASVVASVLSSVKIAFGGSVSGTGTSDAEAYEKSIGRQGLVGVDMQTNSLVDSIDSLVDIDTLLFSASHDLQIAIVRLGKSFASLGGQTYRGFGEFDELSAISAGRSFGTEISGVGSLFGWNSDSWTTEFKGSGVRFAATVDFVGDEIRTSLDRAESYISTLVTHVDKAWYRGDRITTYFRTSFAQLPGDIKTSLTKSLAYTGQVITGLVETLGGGLEVNIRELYQNLDAINLPALQISLAGKTAEEQGDAMAAFFTNLTNKTIGEIIPWITKFAVAGEELADTLIRLAERTIQIDSIFSTLDLSTGDLLKSITSGRSQSAQLELVTAWQESLLSNFKDTDEFTTVFAEFGETVFTEAERTEIALNQAKNVVASGLSVLTQQLEEIGRTDILEGIGAELTVDSLRTLFDRAQSEGIFSPTDDGKWWTGTTGTTTDQTAGLLATMLQLGSAMKSVTDATIALSDEVYNLELRYLRQIETFGLIGKSLELLELSFSFEDAIKEAEEAGASIALVEQYYGLERLDIIRKYNQDITDSIELSQKNVSDSIFSIVSNFEAFDNITYQGIKLEKMANRLASSLANASGLDAFQDIVSIGDELDFEDLFGSLIQFSDSVPESISEQIDLVGNLKDAVMDRYNIEINAIESIKSLALDISGYLKELQVSDLSPLTNAEKLAEAQSQFTSNMADIFSDNVQDSERAKSDLLTSANTLLEQANSFWAIGPQYQEIFNYVVSSLQDLDSSILEEINRSEEAIALEGQTDVLNSIQAQTISQLQTLDNILYSLEDQNTLTLETEIQNLGLEVTTHLDFITNKLQSLNDSTWAPILSALQGMNSYNVGTPYVQNDQIAQIHKGEMIIPTDVASNIRDGSIVNNNSNITNSTSNNKDVVQAIQTLTEVLAISQDDLLESSEQIVDLTKISEATQRKINTGGIV